MFTELDPGKSASVWKGVFQFLVQGLTWNTWEGKAKWILIIVLTLALLIWTVGYLLQGAAKLLEAYKNSGLPMTLNPGKRDKIRRRKQFCSVLQSDLATLAKTENWNDQYFTDLEAEVEAEGGYYASFLHRLFRRQSRGLRRVSSLVEAIESSTEQALLLVGEPGSGKSVALRHLAHQLATRATRSGNLDVKIPLYINLKELGPAADATPDADFIRQFVLDNIRRGDADTAAYVRDHWDEYRDRGVWFFLFDSFDEIPAVLHAPTGSTTIRQHAEAIRQFLVGMSGCRGVLASREYKGPDALPWQTFRILPLSESRREQLLANSFLSSGEKVVVRQHLAVSRSFVNTNPLFLTLLFRYVKEKNKAPANDHDLLSGHIERLACRDTDYIQRKYRLTPDQLLKGAVQLAVLFAEESALSLAPTRDEIAAALGSSVVPGGDLENLLAALVDTKIARSDVREARAGDNRFTFSHRRYQETLFVKYLCDNPEYLNPSILLSDSRWREYAVTLLQTQPIKVLAPIFQEAISMLKKYSHLGKRTRVSPQFGADECYFEWEYDPIVPLLRLLEDGLAHRVSDVPDKLRKHIAQVLIRRWRDGDVYDRYMVIRLGGLLPQEYLERCLEYAVYVGSSEMRDEAYRKVVFLRSIPHQVDNWVRRRLSNEILEAYRRSDLIKLEALAARLPESTGAQFVLRRCLRLRKLLIPCALASVFIHLPVLVAMYLLQRHRIQQELIKSFRSMPPLGLSCLSAIAAVTVVHTIFFIDSNQWV